MLLPNTYEVYRRMLLRLHRGAGSVVQFLSNSVSRELRDSCAFQNATRIKLSRGCCQKTTPPLASGDRLAVHSWPGVVCFFRRRAPISMTVGRAWPSALSRLCTTPRLFSWSTTPEPSTPTVHFVSRNVHVSAFVWRKPPASLSHPSRTENIHCQGSNS